MYGCNDGSLGVSWFGTVSMWQNGSRSSPRVYDLSCQRFLARCGFKRGEQALNPTRKWLFMPMIWIATIGPVNVACWLDSHLGSIDHHFPALIGLHGIFQIHGSSPVGMKVSTSLLSPYG